MAGCLHVIAQDIIVSTRAHLTAERQRYPFTRQLTSMLNPWAPNPRGSLGHNIFCVPGGSEVAPLSLLSEYLTLL
ncbi:unnamed protein product [Chondrus crispus]|uniref:Uncharacterized protein n=1 Tax=Chondrus crispus TaxID=2769 RepID=R7QPU2_CHOCR|nr:unnamed protein product [Chondrus crispus]CDF39808.1 unnamed protein product [Chondrus crispus]|eukprot:XP_005710102.1 unnamed protein product [Chondrus crispus]